MENTFFSFISHRAVVSGTIFLVTLLMVKLASAVHYRRRYKLPPGPWGLPVVGYLPFFGKSPPVTYNSLRKTYGDVFMVKLGSWPAVIINGQDAIKAALVTKGDDFSGRPNFFIARFLDGGKSFTFTSVGTIWKMQRNIISHTMYTFTNTRNNPTEDVIRSEAKSIINELLAYKDERFCPNMILDTASRSMIYQFCYGYNSQIRGDHEFLEALHQVRKLPQFVTASNQLNVMPWLRFFMPSKVKQILQNFARDASHREKKIQEHEETFDQYHMRDITDGLIHAGNTLTEKHKAAGLDKKRITAMVNTFLAPGGNTVSAVIKSYVYMMVVQPEVQEKVFEEINNVVGQGRDISLADRPNLPYVEASIHESMRFSGAAPLALPHSTLRDTTLRGYDIPEGTVALVNLYSIAMDEDLWGDPQTYRPERFLTPEGGLNREMTELQSSFSFGRRRCVGEYLARMEIFLFLATLMQRVRFYKPEDHPGYTMNFTSSGLPEPGNYELCVALRD